MDASTMTIIRAQGTRQNVDGMHKISWYMIYCLSQFGRGVAEGSDPISGELRIAVVHRDDVFEETRERKAHCGREDDEV